MLYCIDTPVNKYKSQRALTDDSSKESQIKQRILKVMSAVSKVTHRFRVTATLNHGATYIIYINVKP